MALLKYFKKNDLPDPTGPLSDSIPSSTIATMNEEVEKGRNKNYRKKRGHYESFTSKEKAIIAKKALEIGVTRALRYFEKDSQYEGRPLKESTVRTWVNVYKNELQRKAGSVINELPGKKRGHPLLLGPELDMLLTEYIKKLRESKAVINSSIFVSAAIGIVKSKDSNLLRCNGGHIEVSRAWAKHFLDHIGYSKRRVTTKASVSDVDFAALKAQFIFDIITIAEMEEIPQSLIINWDHTGINYVPVSNWTMAPEGSKRVEVAGHNDKRQITAVFAATMSGEFLPPQIIFAGKTKRCLPSASFPKDWNITYTANHWPNENTSELYIKSILIPYLQKKREELSLSLDHPALVLFDRFKGQCTPSIISLLQTNNIHFVVVPGKCTDRLQPLDVSVNKAVKEHLRNLFQNWYSDQVSMKMKEGVQHPCIDLTMAVMKPLGAHWLIATFDYIKTNPKIILNGFKGAGIALSSN